MRIARLAWLFGVALVLAGFAPVVLFAMGSLLPGAEASSILGVFPDISWMAGVETWLYQRRIKWAPSTGLVFALLGLAVMFLGAFVATHQRPALDALKAHRQDARRRVRQYGAAQRIEPTLN
jgi:hypothetical protein